MWKPAPKRPATFGLVFLALCTAIGITIAQSGGNVKNLHLIGLLPYKGEWQGGLSMQASINIGLEQVNSMNVIPGYRLNLNISDTECDPGKAMKGLFDNISTKPTKIMILGPCCSSVSQAVARTAQYWNIVQMSSVSVSPALSDKKLYPLFARVSSSDSLTNPAKLHLFQHFKWNRIATIHQSQELFSKTIENLRSMLRENGLTVTRSEIFSEEDPAIQVRNLKESDSRIIVGAFYEQKARKVMCEAYKQGLYGRRIVWILTGWLDDNWWLKDDTGIDCTKDQLIQAVEGYFDVGIVYLNPKGNESISGVTPSEWLELYNKRVNYTRLENDNMKPQGTDAVWAIALALKATQEKLIDMGSPKRLENFTYDDSQMSSLIYQSLLNVSFMGVRGPIKFNLNGDLVGMVRLDRVQDGKKKTVGYFTPKDVNDDQLEWVQENPIIWIGGTPPRDSTVLRIENVELSKALYATMCVFSALGILLACAFLGFNVVLRNVKLVKMSSPRLNNVILAGCILCYASVFVQEVGGGHGETGCQVKTALLAVGVSLAFGALFLKTWRVYVIFTNTKMERKMLTDVHLFAMLGVLVLVNVIVIITWAAVEPVSVQNTSNTTRLEEDDSGEVEVKVLEFACVSEHQTYFQGTLYGIQGLVLLFGIFLAYETRHVHYRELNDSKYIGMCIYLVSVLCIPAVVLSVGVETGLNIKYGISSSLVIFGTTVTQCIIFVPKIMSYRRYRLMGTEDSQTHPSNRTPGHSGGHSNNPSRNPSINPSQECSPQGRHPTLTNTPSTTLKPQSLPYLAGHKPSITKSSPTSSFKQRQGQVQTQISFWVPPASPTGQPLTGVVTPTRTTHV